MNTIVQTKGFALIVSFILFVLLSCNIPAIDPTILTPTSGVPVEQTATGITITETAETPAPTDIPPTKTPEPPPPAEIIFRNGNILTINSAQPNAEAIAISGGKIQAVGMDSTVMVYRGPETRVIDLAGRTLMPGFVDSHSHLFNGTFDNLAAGQDLALANGITTLAEFSVRPEGVIRLYDALNAGEVRMRISMYPAHTDACGSFQGFWYEGYLPDTSPGELVHLPGVKVYADGGACNAPAVSYEYPNGIGNGDLHFDKDQLAKMIRDIQVVGYQVAIHALGDRAVASAVDALESVLDGGPNRFRHRIEHAAVLTEELLPRFQPLDAVVSIPGAFPACFWAGDTSAFRYVTPEEFRDYEWRWRELLNANPEAPIGWQGDYPVFGTLNPFDHLLGFVTRTQYKSDGTICEPPIWGADDAVRVEEALHMMTLGAAYSLFREGELGSLEVGKLADMIIISDNPLTIDPLRLSDIQVQATFIAGNTVFCAAESESFCP